MNFNIFLFLYSNVDCIPFNWVTINPYTLDVELADTDMTELEKANSFSFESKIGRLEHRQSVFEYTVDVIIKNMSL